MSRESGRGHADGQDDRAERSSNRLSFVLNHLPIAIWTVDRDLRFTSIEGRALSMVGVSEGDLLGRTVPEILLDGHHRRRAIRTYREALEGESGAFETEFGGRSWDVHLEPLRAEGKIVGVAGVAMDVTEREKAHQAVQEQRALFRKLFDESPEGIVLVDREDRVLDANAEFERMFGYERDEVLGRQINELIVPEGRKREAWELTLRVTSGERLETEAVRQRKDGTPVDVSILATPVEGAEEDVVYGVYRDITEQKALEAQLLHSQRLEAVGQLAGGVAHDFNNILTAILGHGRVLLSELDEGWIRDDIEEIVAAAERAATLTRQLLTFSRRDMTPPRAVDLDAVIADTRQLLARLIGDQVQLVTELCGELPPVLADPGQLQQVVMNLVLNARDAMEEGGRVEVRTHRWRDPPKESSLASSVPEAVVLEVRDDGRGMSDDVAARIFEPFFTTKPPGEGTGLGMSTVYGIVEQAGGSIEVSTGPGEGTTIRVWFPVHELDPVEGRETAPEAPSTEPSREAHVGDGSPPGSPGVGGESILLVDDDAAVLQVTRRILERDGYEVLTADSGAAALGLVDSLDRPPDLMVTDIVMPGMSGYDLAHHLEERVPGLRVLFMTGYTDQLAGREERPDSPLVTKPFDARTLSRRVREILSEPPSR